MKIDDPQLGMPPATSPATGAGTGTRGPLDASWLRALCLEAGADDVGFVGIDRPELGAEAGHARAALRGVQTLVSFVVRMNREPLRTPARSVANLEFHHTGDHLNETARTIVRRLEDAGIRALNPAMGFPMEMDRFPGRTWVVAHKVVAQAAGLGRMGIHRNIIHPRFGNFVLLGTILIDRKVSEEGQWLGDNPCLECKLCVAACPTGAIKPDGGFDFGACYTHNYREFMSGFTSWVEQVAESRDARDYRARVSDSESASMWQSLGFGPNYKAAYCLSVCPAGEDVIGPYMHDKRAHRREVVRPLQDKEEDVYVIADSDAEDHVRKRFPSKRVRHVRSGLRPTGIDGFIASLPLIFQRGKAADVRATYHFRFTGREVREATVRVDRGSLSVGFGLEGEPDLTVTADADAWLGFVREDRGLLGALLTRRIRLRGSPRLLQLFGRLFLT